MTGGPQQLSTGSGTQLDWVVTGWSSPGSVPSFTPALDWVDWVPSFTPALDWVDWDDD